MQQVTKDSYELGAEWLGAFDPRELPMRPEHLVVVLHTLIEGLMMQRILTPDLCPDEVFYEAFAALARLPQRAVGRKAEGSPPPRRLRGCATSVRARCDRDGIVSEEHWHRTAAANPP